MRLRGRVILITGASSGLGRAVATQLAARGGPGSGTRIAVLARREGLLEALRDEIERAGVEALALPGDALDPAFARDSVARIVARWGRLDACLLNIGSGPTQDLREVDVDAVLRVMQLNYDTLVHFLIPAAAVMKRQAEGGLIAHTNSLAGFVGLPLQGPYSAAKAAARVLMETAHLELRDHGVRTVTLCPGFIKTRTGRDEELNRPFEMSEQRAAREVIRAMERERAEALFPRPLAALTRLARALPSSLRESALRRVLGV